MSNLIELPKFEKGICIFRYPTMSYAIEQFYRLFQGALVFQGIFFGILFFLTKRKDIMWYALYLLAVAAYFFINASGIFFNIDENLVGKEAANNAVKYSGASELVIRTSKSKGQLALAVSDNGKGFNPEAGYAGNGINNMKKRAEETGGQLSILSGAKAGTEISYCCNIT